MGDLKQFKVETQEISYKRIFLLSDLHFGVRANSLEWLENMKSFFYNFYIPYIKKNYIEGDCLFFLGDFFDNRQLLDINVLNVSIDIVIDISKILPLYLITGNHDIYKKYDTDVNSIVAFRYIPNVVIYEKPIIVTNGQSRILIMPWIGNKNTEESYIRANKYDYIFTHTNIAGFKFDNGKDIKPTHALDLSNFSQIKRLFSGHIHKRQEMGNLIYIGSPYHTKRSDISNSKGLYIFDPINNNVQFIPNNFSPIFQRILLENILDFSLENTINLLNNNYTDIIVSDKYIHLFNLTKFIDILDDCQYKKIETVGERRKLDEQFSDILDAIETRDILSLLEINITDLGYQMEMLVKLKLLNRKYYEKASREDID